MKKEKQNWCHDETTLMICIRNLFISCLEDETYLKAKLCFLAVCFGQKCKITKEIRRIWREFKLTDEKGRVPQYIKEIVSSKKISITFE